MVVLAAAFCVLCVHYWPVLSSPNRTLFSGTGDGLKNYYAFAYHVVHDSTLMQFGGMNHPFGEQIGYPDAQPALSGAVKAASAIVPSLEEHTVAIVNLAALLGMVLTAFSIYLLLIHFGVNWLYAGLCGIALAALSPQTLRIQAAHHGLSYGWTLTLTAFFFLRTISSARSARWALFGGAITFIGLYLHPYTGMITASWMGFLLVLVGLPMIRHKDWTRLLHAGALVAGPIAAFLIVQTLTDHHTGRTAHPLGFFEYCTNWSGVLSPPSGYRSALSWLVFPFNMPQEFEATAYMGIGAMLGILVLLPTRAIQWAQNAPPIEGELKWPFHLTALLLAALPLLVFAFGLPFSESHGPYPWSIPFVGQFRSPGRFGWSAYYAFGLFVMFGAWWLWTRSSGAWRWGAAAFAGAIPLIYLYEANAMHIQVSTSIAQHRNVLSATGLSEEEKALIAQVDASRYRAIIPIPHFLAGSDERLLLPDDRTMHLAMVLSYWSGLPMTAYSLARTSVTETIEQLGLLNSPWYERPVMKHYAADDRFLLVAAAAPTNDEEARYLELADPVGAFGSVRLLSLSAGELFKDREEELFQALERMAGDSLTNEWISTSPGAQVLHYPLDSMAAEHVYAGNGAYSGLKSKVNTFATVPPFTLEKGGRYIASYWTYTKGALRSHALTCVAQRDPNTGHEDWITCSDMRFARIVNGDWSLVELPFTVNREEDQYRIFAEGRKTYRDTIWCDEVMIRPANAQSFRVLEHEGDRITKVIYNGHLLTRPR